MAEPEKKGNAEPIPKTAKVESPFWREKIIILVMVGIFAADQVSKALVVQRFETPNDTRQRMDF